MRKKTRSRLNHLASGKVYYNITIADGSYVITIYSDGHCNGAINPTRKELNGILDEHRR